MILGLRMLFALIALTASWSAQAQSLRMRTQPPPISKDPESPWGGLFRYSVVSDYADDRSPRAYVNSLALSGGYKFNENWSLNGELGMKAELLDGQIHKGQEQAYEEVLNVSTPLELAYEGKFFKRHSYTFSAHGEPLWDDASRREGYKGLIGAGGEVSLSFFNKTYSLTNMLDVSELINEYEYGSNLLPNPDYFVVYKLVNSIRFLKTYKFSVSFGLKSTRYLDGFYSYDYNTAFSFSKKWGALTTALSYDSGGFTDQGEVRLWYLNEFRRIGRLLVSYEF